MGGQQARRQEEGQERVERLEGNDMVREAASLQTLSELQQRNAPGVVHIHSPTREK